MLKLHLFFKRDTGNIIMREQSTEKIPNYFAQKLQKKFDESTLAIVLYGSWLRGKRDTVVDLYVIVDNYRYLDSTVDKILTNFFSPNVYQQVGEHLAGDFRVKFAVIDLEQFKRRVTDDFHPYFWARFAQPTQILYVKNIQVKQALEATFKHATKRMITESVPMLPEQFTTEMLWETALKLTYSAELRSESSTAPQSIIKTSLPELELLTKSVASECSLKSANNVWLNDTNKFDYLKKATIWQTRFFIGKGLSIMRLLKAVFTFENSLDYLVWKIERHTGIKEEPTKLQRKHPLIFSWSLIWRLYRKGGFR